VVETEVVEREPGARPHRRVRAIHVVLPHDEQIPSRIEVVCENRLVSRVDVLGGRPPVLPGENDDDGVVVTGEIWRKVDRSTRHLDRTRRNGRRSRRAEGRVVERSQVGETGIGVRVQAYENLSLDQHGLVELELRPVGVRFAQPRVCRERRKSKCRNDHEH
jgi:hypothetical protein